MSRRKTLDPIREPLASICIATYNHAKYLEHTLHSIFVQPEALQCEVILVDDGSIDETPEVCRQWQQDYHRQIELLRLERHPEQNNSCRARNEAYKLARSKIVIAQSDETIHHYIDTIRQLVKIEPGTFNIATVWNAKECDSSCNDWSKVAVRTPVVNPKLDLVADILYTGNNNPRPFFFLGSLERRHLYSIGGNDEEFNEPGYEDNFFADCLIYGLHLRPKFLDEIIGYHQDHPRKHDSLNPRMQRLYQQKVEQATNTNRWQASHGEWLYQP